MQLLTSHFKSSSVQVGDIDEAFLKNAIKESIANAEPERAKIILKNMTTREQKINPQIIEAYEIAFYINFQPVLVKPFIKIVCKYLYKHQAQLPLLRQILLIIAKVALTTTSLRTLERIFQSKELMDALLANVIEVWWTPYATA